MRGTFRFGKIAGIPLGLHWSLLVIAAFLSLSLGAEQLPNAQPGLATWIYVVGGIAGALALLVSVLLHELGHALAARRYDVGTDRIELSLLGGLARLAKEPPTARSELVIAAAGPAVSLAIGGIGIGSAFGLSALGVPTVIATVFGWLGVVNVILGLFNLVPAGPLDGGRILMAIQWMRHGDKERAGITAAKAGRLFGYALVAFGTFELLNNRPGVWTMVIGWFVLATSRAEELVLRARLGLRRFVVRDVMGRGAARFPAWTPVASVREQRRLFPGDVVVVEGAGGEITGFVTFAQLRGVHPVDLEWARLEHLAVPVGTAGVTTPDEPVLDAMERLSRLVPALAVWDGARITGVITAAELRDAAARPMSAQPRPAPTGVR